MIYAFMSVVNSGTAHSVIYEFLELFGNIMITKMFQDSDIGALIFLLYIFRYPS